MDKSLYCNINLFSMNQNVYAINGNEITFLTTTTIEKLPEVLYNLVPEGVTYSIQLTADPATGEMIAEHIKQLEIANYSVKHINTYLIGEINK